MEAGIDVDIARWILEFLIWQPLEDRTLNTLIEILPLTDDNCSIKKSLLLRKLDSETAAGIPSEEMLDLLELIEELDFRCRFSGHSASLQTAYCHVAIATTVRWLHDEAQYLRAVKRIWRARVSKMVEAKVGLVSEELRFWAADIEKAVLDDGWIAELREKSGRIDAVAVVRQYVKEEKKKMAPSFLEVLAEASTTDDSLREKLRDGDATTSSPAAATVNHSANGVTQQGTKRKYKRTSRGAKIAVADDSGTHKYNLRSSPEVDAVQKALNLSSSGLKSVVNDPINLASNIVSGAASKDAATEMPVEEADHGGDVGAVEQKHDGNGVNTANDCSKQQRGPSLMQRNSTAQTMEWEDDPSDGKRVPETRPLNIRLDKRRKARRWSSSEEVTLKTGVETFGKGKWKLILQEYRDILKDRTEVDLKDKWRNMTK